MTKKIINDQIEPVYGAIGSRVKYIREMLGSTQIELAKKAGITRTSLVNFESGNQRCPLHTIEKIAFALGTTPKNLMKGIWT